MGFKVRGAINAITPGRTPADKMLFGDKAGQAAETARLAEMFRQQNEKARAELNAVLAERPEYASMLTSPEFAQQKQFAFGDESTKGFLMQRAREEQNLQDALQAQTQAQGGQVANAYSQLAMGGGLSSGARERIAAGGAQSGLLSRQGLRSQAAKNLMDLGISEEGQRFASRGGVLQSQMQDIANKNTAAQDAWKTKAQTLAGLGQSEQQGGVALATRPQDKGMCCFIFAEANALSPVVRRYRDEFMTDRNRRGYYKLAEVLVPLMRKSKVVNWLVKTTMIKPLTWYGEKFYEGKNPNPIIKDFWIGLFNYLGQDHEFKRVNGEVI